MPRLVAEAGSDKAFFESTLLLFKDPLFIILAFCSQLERVKTDFLLRAGVARALFKSKFEQLLKLEVFSFLFFLIQADFVENGLRVNKTRLVVAFNLIVTVIGKLSNLSSFSTVLNHSSVLHKWILRDCLGLGCVCLNIW